MALEDNMTCHAHAVTAIYVEVMQKGRVAEGKPPKRPNCTRRRPFILY